MPILIDFWKDPFKRTLVLALILLYGVLWFRGEEGVPPAPKAGLQMDFYFHPNCGHCQAQKPFNQELLKKFPGLKLVEHDISRPEEAERLRKIFSARDVAPATWGVPATFIGSFQFIGFDRAESMGQRIEASLRSIHTEAAPAGLPETEVMLIPGPIRIPLLGEIDIRNYSLLPVTVILGLVDGFNPCAMWVLVYLLSVMVGLQDRRKTWWLAGTFVFASGVLYFLFLSAWLNAFLLLGYLRSVTLLVGVFALGLGLTHLRNAARAPAALVCEVGDAESKKKTMGRISRLIASPLGIGAVGGMVVLAFLVNSIEFACSAGIPAVFTQVLSLADLSRGAHYGYILLYDFFFMLDDLLIFGLAAFAVNSSWGVKYARLGQWIGGTALFLLGLLLCFAPQWLR